MQFLSKIPGNFMNFQNFMEAELLDPVLWNFAWINGRLYAFRWNQSEFPKINTLGTIKVLLVSLAFEHRVHFGVAPFQNWKWILFSVFFTASKQIELEMWDWRQMKALLNIFQMVYDINWFPLLQMLKIK